MSYRSCTAVKKAESESYQYFTRAIILILNAEY